MPCSSQDPKILWCYLIWYVYFVYKYFDFTIELWGSSLAIAIIVGLALNINAFASPKEIIDPGNIWKVIRFFIIPFCVASFPALIKGKGFILFFSPNMKENLIAISLCVFFLVLTYLSKLIVTS